MGDVTAVNMDIVTDKSGHAFTPMAVSVCITPAAPSPLPMPYPVTGTSTEGVTDECMRTKVNGGKCMTVGSVFNACHGNEPGTLKEVVSLNTGGPCFSVMGAPTVFLELGMATITGSPGFLNKAPTAGAGGSASGASGASAGGGSGGDGSGGDGSGNNKQGSNSGGGGGGGGSGANAPTPEQRALAAEQNANPDDGKNAARVAARKKVAADFSRNHGQKLDRTTGQVRPLTRAERKSELACIDYNKPVTTGPPPPCPSPIGQWQAPGGNRGSYFAPAGTQPGQLGIGSQGTAWNQPGKPVVAKQETMHTIPPNQPYMTSTASPANDTWSTPGTPQPAPGGGTQIQVPGGVNPNSGITP
jgi:hypothetical protein